PRAAARPSRARSSHQLSVGTALSNKSFERRALRFRDLVDPGAGQVEERVEQLACERLALGGRLRPDPATGADPQEVHVDLRARTLLVVEFEERLAVDDPDRDRGDRAGERLAEPEAVERAPGGDVRTGDRRATRAAVRLQHVAVEVDRALAERVEVRYRAD